MKRLKFSILRKRDLVKRTTKVNIVIAAFTTAYARLKLYNLLDLLQERVLYYDTDSVVYVHEPGKPDPPLGDYLGELTDELNGGLHHDVSFGWSKELWVRHKYWRSYTQNTWYQLNV